MIIKSLKLENYRRFTSLFLEFPENLIGIVGRNGSGKSTLIEAIGWVLYGNRLGRSDKHDIRSQIADPKAACSVEMICVYGDHEYRIVRSLKGVNAVSEAAVYRDANSDPVAVQDRGVNAFIQELLQLDYNSFTASVFARQKDLDRLSSLEPEERRRSINRLIGIDKIDTARTQVRRDKNDKLQFLDGKTSSLKDLDELGSRLSDMKTARKEHKDKVDQLATTVKEKSAILEQSKKELERQTELRDKHNKLDAQLGKLQTSLDENRKMESRHQDDLTSAQNAAAQFVKLAGPLAEFDNIRKQKQAMDQEQVNETSRQSKKKEIERIRESLQREDSRAAEYQQQAEKLANIQDQLKQLHEQETKADKDRQNLHKELSSIQGAIESITRDGEKERKKLENIKELGPDGECPTCTQRLGNHYESVTAELNVQIESLRSEYRQKTQQEKEKQQELGKQESLLAELRRQRESLLKDETGAREADKTLQRIQEAIDSYNKQIELVSNELAALGDGQYSAKDHAKLNTQYEELLEIKDKAARLEEQQKRLPQIEQDLKITRDNIERLQKENDDLQAKQQSLQYREEDYENSRKDVAAKDSDLFSIRDEHAVARENLAGLTSQVKALENEIAEQKKARAEIESVKQEVHYLAALDEHFGGFRTALANRVRPLIASRASALLSLTTNMRYTLLELDQDYNIHIYDGTEPFSIQRFSGGEQDLANLCLRIAISQIVAERSGSAPINFIVLDEIFGSQDTERRDLILQALGKLSEQFRQVFLITHIEPIKDMLPAIIQVDACDDQTSQAVLI